MPVHRPLALAAPILATLLTAAPAAAQEAARSGTFMEAGGHDASGGVEIVEEGGAYTVVLAEDFRMDRAPDPYLAFGSADAFAEGTDFAVVESRRGGQSYAVPGGIDPTEHEAVWLWCREVGVPLGVALLD